MILAFGKYKGQLLEDVPDNYLEWLDEQEWVKGLTRQALDAELKRRFLKSGYTPEPPGFSCISSLYKELAKKYHPDKGGSNEAMQAINEFYTALKKISA